MMKQNYITPTIVSVVSSALMADVMLPISGVVDKENQAPRLEHEEFHTWPSVSTPWEE
ncbi:MAG: hypothetical protein Q4A44_05010 [Bacteroidales bacterium]|nr:hypothetical protein [Bacteroidales bacterium]